MRQNLSTTLPNLAQRYYYMHTPFTAQRVPLHQSSVVLARPHQVVLVRKVRRVPPAAVLCFRVAEVDDQVTLFDLRAVSSWRSRLDVKEGSFLRQPTYLPSTSFSFQCLQHCLTFLEMIRKILYKIHWLPANIWDFPLVWPNSSKCLKKKCRS